MQLFWALVLAHLTADFLQPAALVRWTKRSAWGLAAHVATYAALTTLVLAGRGWSWWPWLALLVATHLAIDRTKIALDRRLGTGSFYVLTADQLLHFCVIAYVAFVGLAGYGASPLLSMLPADPAPLESVTAYVTVTFTVSIVVFEAGRTFAPDPVGTKVASWAWRLPGMVERTLAVLLAHAGLYPLAPLAFAFSGYRLARDWATSRRRRDVIELGVSAASTVVVAATMLR